MNFLLLFRMERSAMPDKETSDRCFRDMMEFVGELKRGGHLIFDSQVLSEAEALRVTREAGIPRIRQGPFLEFPETIGGFFVIRAKSREEAVEIATRCPHQQVGPVELRPLNDTDLNAYP